jgi:AbiJ N-terminal domain 4
MLTDIFARRYEQKNFSFGSDSDARKLLVQLFRIISEQVCPYYIKGNEHAEGKTFWAEVHAELSMELGLASLSEKPHPTANWHDVCERWMLRQQGILESHSNYFNERISFVELCFRKKQEILNRRSAELPNKAKSNLLKGFGNSTYINKINSTALTDALKSFADSTIELNSRFAQAGVRLHYHNGFIQFSEDGLLSSQIERPFWNLLADPKWKNVDTDFKEAIDRRDNLDRDPDFYAMKSLESAIKIISEAKGLTVVNDKPANHYIDHLGSSTSKQWLKPWEAQQLRTLFKNARNPAGHGPGSAQMPKLTANETNLVLDTAMVWIKCLVTRSSL